MSVGIELDITSASYVYIDFDYDEDVLADVKKIPGREFVDTENRPNQWKFKLNKVTMKPFLEFVDKWDVDVPTSIENRMREIVEEARRLEEQKEKNEEILSKDEPDLDRVYGTARGMELYDFQKKAVEYVENNGKVIIGDQQGLGKTVSAITSIHHMDAYPALVVCPATLKYNWEKEWNAWLPRKTVKVQEASEGLDLRARVCIINYAILWRYREELREHDWGAMVLDESHYCFPGDQEVVTKTGTKPIADVEYGDVVASYDASEGKDCYRKVTETMAREHEGEMVVVETESGSVTCTPEHILRTPGKWKRASDLTSEDEVLSLNGEDKAYPVKSVETTDERSETVYDLTVEDTHCYYVGGLLAHNCKNGSAKRTKAAKQIARRMDEDAVKLLLSGTAVVNQPSELIHQLKIIDAFEKEFGNYYQYTKKFCDGYKSRWGWDASGASNLDELHSRLTRTCYIRRDKEDVMPELPDKQRQYIELDIGNREEYDAAEADVAAYMRKERKQGGKLLEDVDDPDRAAERVKQNMGAGEEAMGRLVKLMKLKQLAAKGKFNPAKKWIRDFLKSESPLVVFGWHKEIVKGIADAFDCPYITGDVDNQRRHDIVEEFQDGQHDIISLNMHAAGEGITLTEASNAVFLELPWTWGTVSQCEDRIHRIGTEEAVNIYFLLGRETIDKDVFELLMEKRKVTEKVNRGKDVSDDELDVIDGVIERLKQK